MNGTVELKFKHYYCEGYAYAPYKRFGGRIANHLIILKLTEEQFRWEHADHVARKEFELAKLELQYEIRNWAIGLIVKFPALQKQIEDVFEDFDLALDRLETLAQDSVKIPRPEDAGPIGEADV